MTISEEDYFDAVDSYSGYCEKCDAITVSSGVEPDATNYRCEACNTNSVMGIEEAMIAGKISLEEN